MSIEPRRKPYIWPTWIAPLLSGDRHCEWAAWLRAHYTYTKRVDETRDGVNDDAVSERENSLAQWKGHHARRVSYQADSLSADGWAVRLEDQNRFTYRGQVAIVGGCPDIVATKDGVVRIDDVKTGKARDADFWQVAIYGMLLPLVDETLAELVVSGAVVYLDRVRPISPSAIVESRPAIVAQIKRTAAAVEPARRPSAVECAFCDIADCPDRIVAADALSAEGDAF